MSDLESIQDEPKAKRKLMNISFDHPGAHIAYTDGSQGGAASLKNEPYLLKAEDIKKELTDEQKEILEAIGEESTPLDKANGGDKNAPSSSTEVVSGEDENLSKQKEDEMSQEMQNKLAELQKQVDVMNAEKTVVAYKFDAELEKGLAEALATLPEESAEFVTKALSTLVERSNEALEKANAEKVEDTENDLTKALDSEAGHSKEEEAVEKSLLEQAAEAKAELEKEAK